MKCNRSKELKDALKWKYSFYSALLFFVFSSPEMYKLTTHLLPTSNNGCPTSLGLLIHTVVFMLAIYGFMKLPKDV